MPTNIAFEPASDITSIVDDVNRHAQHWLAGGSHIVNGVQESFDVSLATLREKYTSAGRHIIVDMLRDVAEKLRSTGADPAASVKFACDVYDVCNRQSRHQAGTILVDISTRVQLLVGCSRRPFARELREWISHRRFRHATTRDVFTSLLEFAGVEGRVVLEYGDVKQPVIERHIGYNFTHVRPLTSVTRGLTWNDADVRILLYDGACSSVAELDCVFNATISSREPLVICARMFDPDVVSTIAANNARGTFNIMPVVVPFDMDGANTLKDIAVITRGDVITTGDGRLLTSITTLDELGSASRVSATQDCLSITEQRTHDDVNMHVSFLRSMLTDELRASAVRRRIASLTPTLVTVTIPRRDALLHHELAECLRYMRVMSDGCVTCDDITHLCEQHAALKIAFECLSSAYNDVIPTRIAIMTIMTCLSFCRQVLDIGCIIDASLPA